jgi:hypothetical protein
VAQNEGDLEFLLSSLFIGSVVAMTAAGTAVANPLQVPARL